MKGPTPLVTLTIAAPSDPPKHVTTIESILTDKPNASTTSIDPLAVQPLKSVTTTLYIPAGNPVAVAVVCAPRSSHK